MTAEQAVISDLAAGEAAALERVRVLEVEQRFLSEDNAVLRELAREAVERLHQQQQEHSALKKAHERLLDEYRWLRRNLLGAAA